MNSAPFPSKAGHDQTKDFGGKRSVIATARQGQNILLFQLDGKIPNIALMRIAAHHKAMGDEISFRWTGTPRKELWDNPDNWIVESSPLNLNAPTEEAAERHHVALRGGFRDAALQSLVESPDVLAVNTARCERSRRAGGELSKRNGLRGRALLRVLIHAELVGNETLGFVCQILVGHYQRIVDDIRRFADRFTQISGTEINPFPHAADLSAPPIRAALQIQILHRSQNWFTDWVSETRRFCGKLRNRWCAVQGSNLRPLPCQGNGRHRGVHRFAFTEGGVS